jgi:hypothetical protein
MPPPTCPVDATHRRGRRFNPQVRIVHEANFTGSGGPQLLVPENHSRIAVWVYAPITNSFLVLIGARDMRTTGDGSQGMDMEPGTGWWIDDTTADIYAVTDVGGGDQVVKFFESTDPLLAGDLGTAAPA